ncbi:MAG: hypothetical protein K8S97_15860, partial [Anaerolineae bacterium]|nr:hypothetical protein [Anaerolineae bacterium]
TNVIQRARSNRRTIVLLLPFVWAFVELSAYALRLPVTYQHGRYVMPVLPHLILYGVGGTFLLLRAGRRSATRRVLTRTLAMAAVGLVPGFFVIGARQYGADVRIINTEMVATAHWSRITFRPTNYSPCMISARSVTMPRVRFSIWRGWSARRLCRSSRMTQR